MTPERQGKERPQREFSRPFSVGFLKGQEVAESVVAGPAERKALAGRFDLPSLDLLRAELVLRRVGAGQVVRVTGRLEARARQTCVVTLEPIEIHIENAIHAEFAPPSAVEEEELLLEAGPGEPPEEIEADGTIDLGELVAQQFAVLLDPYPRKPGARFESEPEEERSEEERGAANPFAALRDLGPRR